MEKTSPAHAWSSRLYESEQDLRQMQDLLMEARLRTNDWHYFHIGEMMWAFFMVLCHLNPQEFIRLWHDASGKLIGYAILGEDPSLDVQVLPEYEWLGIETEALDWAETRVSGLVKHAAQKWGGHFVSGARQDDTQRIAFLEQHGFRHRGTFSEVNMLRSLDEPIPTSIIAPGFEIRAVKDDETSDRAGAGRDVWLPWSVGNIDDNDYTRLMRLPAYERELDLVVIAPGGIIASYVNCWIDPINRIGDFGPVGARPAFRRQGLTRAVLLEGLRRFKVHGMNRACVSTTVTNTPARNLYESVGFKIVNQYLDFEKAG